MTAISAARDVLSMRVPTHPSSAGSSVSEPRIIISTPTDAATAMPETKLSPITVRPIREMITVIPARQDGPSAGVHRFGDGVLDAEAEA